MASIPSGGAAEVPAAIAVHYLDRSALALAEALTRDPPDLLFSAGNAMAIAAAAKARAPEVPLVIRASSHPRRSIPWSRPRQRLLEPIRRARRQQRYGAADLVIAVSADVASAVRQMVPNVPVLDLPSPVITPRFLEQLNETPSHPWLADQVPIILAVGRFAVPKDFPTLVRAFARVRSRREVRLVLLGDGPPRFRNELIELSRRLGVESDAAFPGWESNVAGWLAAASLFVSTSIWEGSPGAVIEAMAAGCPIVATDCPGDTRHLLDGGRLGGLAPVGDAAAIAAEIERQLDDPVDAELLRAAASPYFEAAAAKAHLDALDRFVAAFERPLRSSRAPLPR